MIYVKLCIFCRYLPAGKSDEVLKRKREEYRFVRKYHHTLYRLTLGFQPRGLDHGPGPLAKDLVVKMADYLKELDDKEKNEMQPYFSHRSPPQTFIAFLIINSGRGRIFV